MPVYLNRRETYRQEHDTEITADVYVEFCRGTILHSSPQLFEDHVILKLVWQLVHVRFNTPGCAKK